jgi:hypothetical protein
MACSSNVWRFDQRFNAIKSVFLALSSSYFSVTLSFLPAPW